MKNTLPIIDQDYLKIRLSLRNYFLGRSKQDPSFFKVIKSMDIAEKYHNGKRKDGKDEISHQFLIAAYIMTIEDSLIDPIAAYIVAFLHDTYEDYQVESEQDLKEYFSEYLDMIIRISKVRDGVKIQYDEYFSEMALCPVCSIVKAVDRFQNISSMIVPFSTEKQNNYLLDLDNWFFPMIKKAKRKYPEQTQAYENLKYVLLVIRNMVFTRQHKKSNL